MRVVVPSLGDLRHKGQKQRIKFSLKKLRTDKEGKGL